ncbi:MAG: hypothetical protein ACLU3I_06395 [Acutalibacteraceae bacterium]
MILLAVLFWLTLEGSNVFSVWLQSGFDWLQRVLLQACSGWPHWLADALISGVYATAARVTAVMLRLRRSSFSCFLSWRTPDICRVQPS